MALRAMLAVLGKYTSKMRSVDSRLWPDTLAISGALQPAMASRTMAVRRKSLACR